MSRMVPAVDLNLKWKQRPLAADGIRIISRSRRREEWRDRRRIDYKKMRRLEVDHRIKNGKKEGKEVRRFFCLGELDVKNSGSRLRRLHLSALTHSVRHS